MHKNIFGTRFSAYAVFSLVVLAVWWPDGFNIGPISDGWIRVAHADVLNPEFGTRVLQTVPRALGLALTPGSFLGWQGLLLVLTLARGILVFEIVFRLVPELRGFGLVCGLLAMFHPLDSVFFWVDASNVHTGYALTLAACLAALIHLQHGSRISLLALVLLQIAACFMYSGFLLILIGFPVGLWMLSRLEGRRASPAYPLKVTAPVLLFIGFTVYEAAQGAGREGKVVDLSMLGVLKGYLFQLRALGASLVGFVMHLKWAYLPPALVAGMVAGFASIRSDIPDKRMGRPWRFYAMAALGLVVLAGLAYAPYAVSELRFSHRREMLAAGLFLLMAGMLPGFVWLSRQRIPRPAHALLTALFAMAVVATGLEMRRWYVTEYRTEEALLAAVAEAVPQPPPDAFILVVVPRSARTHGLGGFYNRWLAYSEALRLMYGEDGLEGGFVHHRAGRLQMRFDAGGVSVSSRRHKIAIPYERLILLDYRRDGSMQLVDQVTLRQQAPAGTDLGAYRPSGYGDAPRPGASVCSLLEAHLRPGYCR